jgi:uncharacterized membrane protein
MVGILSLFVPAVRNLLRKFIIWIQIIVSVLLLLLGFTLLFGEILTNGYFWYVLIFFGSIGAYSFGLHLWLTAHKIREPIVSEFEPYQNLPPMYTGVLFDGVLHSRDIAAGLVDLARRGFIRIKHVERDVLHFFTDTDYEITLLQPTSALNSEFEKVLLRMLFEDIDHYSGYQSPFKIKFQNKKTEFNPISAVAVGKTVSLDVIRASQRKQIGNRRLLQQLQAALAKDLEREGYMERSGFLDRFLSQLGSGQLPVSFFQIIVYFLIIVSVFFGIYLLSVWLAMVAFPVLLFTIVFISEYPRRTVAGYQAKRHLKGFKEFLSVTDEQRFAFHNAPEKNPETFMQYLPYAIAFGVEEKWSAVFADLNLPTPDWYETSSPHSFTPQVFVADITSLTKSFTTSTSSSGSGSGGGGRAGGGGGGGGGGSW